MSPRSAGERAASVGARTDAAAQVNTGNDEAAGEQAPASPADSELSGAVSLVGHEVVELPSPSERGSPLHPAQPAAVVVASADVLRAMEQALKHAGPQEMSLSSRKVWAFAQMCIRIRGGPPPTLSDVETCLADEDWLDDVTKGE